MPPAFEVLLLNTAVPQIQAAQSGDTYVVPRDIAFSAALTLSAGTANGVPYLSSPGKVLTTGSALTFDGTNLATTGDVLLNNARYYYAKSSAGSNVRLLGINSGDTLYLGIDAGPTSMIVNASSTSTNIVFNASGSEIMRLTTTGLKASIAGTNADPVFSYTSDTNTGIFFPAADKLGFVAGGGSDQMVLTTTGLGIGTNNPAALLHLSSGAGTKAIWGTTRNFTVNRNFQLAVDEFAEGQFTITPSTTLGGTTFTTPVVAINATGNVGIGTSSPAAKLQVLGSGKGTIFGSSSAQNFYSAWQYNSTDVGYIGNGASIVGAAAPTDFGLTAFTGGKLWLGTNNGASYAVIDSSGNLGLGDSASRATTAGTRVLNIFDGTAPVGTLANGVSFYSTAGEARVMDAAGNATLLSPHDTETNEWIFHSKHTPTGKVLRIDVERLLKFVNDHFGLDAVQEFIEE